MLRKDVDFSQIQGQLSELATGLTNELFAPGGAVEDATGQALRSTVQTGFGPSSGGFDRARQNILTGARDQVANRIAQATPQFAQLALQERGQRVGNELGLFQNLLGTETGLRESLFGGRATVENLRLAQEQQALNRRLIEERLGQEGGYDFGRGLSGAASGALSGAAAGSVVPGLGTLAGGIIGGIGGLFGGF